ncbi:hypothetical protein C8J57DRAFT_1066761 [Mycena rebaudengoi]|nr:hypothetical protein C8J57DRAFT_1066761 [Mycena rebaudengoi]
MFNSFQNDKAYISVRWLIELVIKRGLVIRHLLIVRHKSTGTFHYIAILSDGHYICDCCMPANIGIPCRHYFRIWIDVQKLPFHISFIRSWPVPLQLTTSNIQLIFRFYSWYQDPELLVHTVPAVCRTHELQAKEFQLPTQSVGSAFGSNPIDSTSHQATPPPPTQTLPGREVFHSVQAALRPLISGVQT